MPIIWFVSSIRDGLIIKTCDKNAIVMIPSVAHRITVMYAGFAAFLDGRMLLRGLIVLGTAFFNLQAMAAAASKDASCTEFAAGASACNGNGCFVCTGTVWVGQPLHLGTSSATCDGTIESLLRYNATTRELELCTGTAWTPLIKVQSTPAPPTSGGSGYFVITATTWNGILGGRAGADAKCLTELSTTYTNWKGYTEANARGQLISSKVKAFLCDASACNNLTASTPYYFARADSATAGGASFTTDASGIGPNDSADWSAANYFAGTYTFYTNRAAGSATAWGTTGRSTHPTNTCNSWNAGDASYFGYHGISAISTNSRWTAPNLISCENSFSLICLVNP